MPYKGEVCAITLRKEALGPFVEIGFSDRLDR